MQEGRSAPAEVTALVTSWIEARRAEGLSFQAIADKLGVTKTQVINVHGGSRGVGTALEQNFANAEHAGSVDALRKAAREAWLASRREAPALTPNLKAAVDALRLSDPPADEDIEKARKVSAFGADFALPTWIAILTDLARIRRAKLPLRRPRSAP